jgi:gliding motility-associated-like protein
MKKFLLIITLILSSLSGIYASHIPGGNVTWACTGNPNEFVFTIKLYVSCPSVLSTTSLTATMNNTCGLVNPTLVLPFIDSVEVSQICNDAASDCGSGTWPGVREYTYRDTITLPDTCDSWEFVFSQCCRDAANNLTGTTSNTFYVKSQMNSGTAPCDASPYVTANAIPYVCAGVQQTYCPAAIDPDGDSLYYSLVSPMGATGTAIGHSGVYTPTTPLQNLTFDPVTGCIVFTQPTTGNYVVTYKIEAFDAAGNQTGYIHHDFQVEVVNNPNCQPPGPLTGVTNHTGSGIVTGSNTVEICEGQNFCIDIEFSDADVGDTLRIDSSNTNVWAAMPGVTVTPNYPFAPDSLNHLTLTVCWNVPVGASPNTQGSVGVTDGSCPIENLGTFPIIVNVINATVANPPLIICGPQTAPLTANGGSVFTWFYTATGTQVPVGPEFSCNPCANPIAKPIVSTNYYVVSNLSIGCNNSDSTSVTVVPDFTPTVYGDTLLCDFLTKQIGVNVAPAGAGYTYLWNNGGSLTNDLINNPIASPTQTTAYTVTVTSPFNCVKEDTVTVSVNPPPSVTLIPGDTVLCQGESIDMDVSLTAVEDDFTGTFDPLVWSNVSGASVGTPCIPFNGTALNFNATNRELNTAAANVASCTSIDFCLFVANNSSTGIGCENADAGEDIELNYSINGTTWINIATYVTGDWDTGGPYANSWQCFSIPIPAGAATTNTMFQWKQIGIYGGTIDNWALDDIAIVCGGNSNYSYQWNPGTGLTDDTINNPIASPTTTTVYTVTLTDTGGCSVDRSQTITVAPNFTTTVTQSAGNTCLYDPVQLNAAVTPGGAGYTYEWSPSTFLSDTTIANPVATITTPGNHQYYVRTIGPGGCEKLDTINITISPNIAPTFTLTASDTLILCGQQTIFDLVQDTLVVPGNMDDFNGAVINPLSWSSVSNGLLNTNCGSITGNALHFDGPGALREAITSVQNVTSCTSVEFSLFIGNSASGGAPCENADAAEDVEFSYSTAGPTGPWTLIQLYDDNDWDAGGIYANAWQNFIVPIPIAAQTPTTYFKWDQPTFSNCTGCDNWAIDDISISCPPPVTNYTYSWTPNDGSLDDDTLQNPTASPSNTTMYYITVTDPNGGCTSSDSLEINVLCDCDPSVPIVTSPSCKDGNDGQIIAAPQFNAQSLQKVVMWYDNSTAPPTLIQTSDTLYTGDTDTLIGISAGDYTISTWDSIFGGCVSDTIITVTEPDSVLIDPTTLTADDTLCIGGSMTLDVIASGGSNTTYTYTWTNENTGANVPGAPFNISPIDTTTIYSVIATDPLGCISDTGIVTIYLHDSITAVPVIVSTIADTIKICPTITADLGMSATGGNGGPYTYEWFENGTSISTNQFYTVEPTTSLTTYIGVASDDCGSPQGTVTIHVKWNNLVTPTFIKLDEDSCYPITVDFVNTTPMTFVDVATIQWSVSNGDNGTGVTFTSTFDTPVCKDITLSFMTTDGCPVETTYTDFVCPHDYPVANFDMSPPVTNLLNTEIEFNNLSTGTTGLTYLWNFGSGLNPDSSTVTHPTFNYPDNAPGTYNVMLTVTDENDCEASIPGTVIVNSVYLFYVPNSFTPDSDGLNDVFRAYGDGIDLSNYSMQIFDRWGELMFETGNATNGWDGTYKGKLVNPGTYVWKIIAKEASGTIIHDNFGHVTLVR